MLMFTHYSVYGFNPDVRLSIITFVTHQCHSDVRLIRRFAYSHNSVMTACPNQTDCEKKWRKNTPLTKPKTRSERFRMLFTRNET